MYVSCAKESDKKVFNKKLSCAEVYIYGSMNVVVKDSFTTNNFATHHLKNQSHQPGRADGFGYCCSVVNGLRALGVESETLGVR